MKRDHVAIACMASGLGCVIAGAAVAFGLAAGLVAFGAGLILVAVLLGWH